MDSYDVLSALVFGTSAAFSGSCLGSDSDIPLGGAFQITTPQPSLHNIAAPQPINLQLLGNSYWICDSFLNACFGRPVPCPQLKSFPDSWWNETVYIGFQMYSRPFWSFLQSFFEFSLHYMIPLKYQFYTFLLGMHDQMYIIIWERIKVFSSKFLDLYISQDCANIEYWQENFESPALWNVHVFGLWDWTWWKPTRAQ